jgi:hypothetical protein
VQLTALVGRRQPASAATSAVIPPLALEVRRAVLGRPGRPSRVRGMPVRCVHAVGGRRPRRARAPDPPLTGPCTLERHLDGGVSWQPLPVIVKMIWHDGSRGDVPASAVAWTHTEVEVEWTTPWHDVRRDWVRADQVRRHDAGADAASLYADHVQPGLRGGQHSPPSSGSHPGAGRASCTTPRYRRAYSSEVQQPRRPQLPFKVRPRRRARRTDQDRPSSTQLLKRWRRFESCRGHCRGHVICCTDCLE